MTFEEFRQSVEKWLSGNRIMCRDPEMHLLKMIETLGELAGAVFRDDRRAISYAAGEMAIQVIIYERITGQRVHYIPELAFHQPKPSVYVGAIADLIDEEIDRINSARKECWALSGIKFILILVSICDFYELNFLDGCELASRELGVHK